LSPAFRSGSRGADRWHTLSRPVERRETTLFDTSFTHN
jgi:hypothetical protein